MKFLLIVLFGVVIFPVFAQDQTDFDMLYDTQNQILKEIKLINETNNNSSYEENFLYPLYLLLIGGGVTGILIPSFHKFSERRQKNIDRQREDYQNEIKIKEQFTNKVSDYFSDVSSNFSIAFPYGEEELAKFEKSKKTVAIEIMTKSLDILSTFTATVPLHFQNSDKIIENMRLLTTTIMGFSSVLIDGYTKDMGHAIFEGLSTLPSAELPEKFSLDYVDEVLKNPYAKMDEMQILVAASGGLFSIVLNEIHYAKMIPRQSA